MAAVRKFVRRMVIVLLTVVAVYVLGFAPYMRLRWGNRDVWVYPHYGPREVYRGLLWAHKTAPFRPVLLGWARIWGVSANIEFICRMYGF